MRNPITATAGNVLWTRAGTSWSVWRLSPVAYGFRPDVEKRRVRALHTMLLRALHGESLLLGLCAREEPASVVERMLHGLDLRQHPAWAAECEATLDVLETVPLGERSFWLALPGPLQGRQRFSAPARAAFAELADQLGLPRWRPSPEQITASVAEAEQRLRAAVPAQFRPRAATPAEMLWLQAHHQRRGLPELPVPASQDEDVLSRLLTVRGGHALGVPLLDEGGQSDVGRSGWQRINPLSRRYLKVSDTRSESPEEASYQCALVLDDVPAAGMTFPGSEYLGELDHSGVDVDWALRLTVRTSDEAQRRIRRAVRDLNDQYGQREGNLSTGTHELDRSARDLQQYEQALAANRDEVSVEATVMFLVAGNTPEDAEAQAQQLTRFFAQAQYRLSRPVGAQETIWWAAQPAVPTERPVRQMAQITTADDLSAAVPLASVELGDRRGVLLGLNVSSPRPGAVFLDLEATVTDQDTSPAVAIAGELGAGKSVALKKLAGDLVDRGGRLLTIDRTQTGEWAKLAAALTDSSVVSAQAPTVSLDPLRLLQGPVGAAGARVAQSFLTALLNVPPTSPQGRLLSDVLEPRWLADHDVDSLGALTIHLETMGPAESDLASYLRAFANKDLGRVIFDGSLPPLDLSARAVVFGTAGLQLPTREELLNDHLFRQMRLEKVFGRAIYALIVALIRQAAFADPSELVVVPLDEAHHVTNSPESQHEVTELIRDGRKHKAAVLLGSHDPQADFGNETLQALIPTRLVARQRDEDLARRSLQWLGLDPEDPWLVELLTKQTSPVNEDTGSVPPERRGEAFMRDARGRIGRVKILPPALPARAEAVLTTPPRSRHHTA